jgi:hypothetical protein
MVLAQHFCTVSFPEVGNRTAKPNACQSKSPNRYDLSDSCCYLLLLFSVSDQAIIMIGPGGLLSVHSLPRICIPDFSFMGEVGKKINNQTWM